MDGWICVCVCVCAGDSNLPYVRAGALTLARKFRQTHSLYRCLAGCLSVSVYPSIHPSVHPSIHPFIFYIYFYVCLRLHGCMCVCVCVREREGERCVYVYKVFECHYYSSLYLLHLYEASVLDKNLFWENQNNCLTDYNHTYLTYFHLEWWCTELRAKRQDQLYGNYLYTGNIKTSFN